jgi:hypothetical protein
LGGDEVLSAVDNARETGLRILHLCTALVDFKIEFIEDLITVTYSPVQLLYLRIGSWEWWRDKLEPFYMRNKK